MRAARATPGALGFTGALRLSALRGHMHISPFSFASLRDRRGPPRPVVEKLPVVNLVANLAGVR
jgi:hypothetical protein